MQRMTSTLVPAFLCVLVPLVCAKAASLSVSPILVEVGDTALSTAITLRNREARPVDAQIRVFRWTQAGGEDKLASTEDVVASPPFVRVDADQDYTIRLRRVSEGAPVAEEAYRVVVDELPDLNRQRNGTVAVVLRYLIPAFFVSPDAGRPRLAWSVTNRDGRSWLTARNSGDKRIQIADLRVKARARTAWIGRGLAGYVLGHSERAWPVPDRLASLNAGMVAAKSDRGPIDARLEP